MITVTVTKEGSFPVTAKKLKDIVKKTLTENGIVSDAVVDVAIVGREKMDELNKKYYKDEVYEHPIFTFPETLADKDFSFPPDSKLHLGQIVLNYPFIVEEANEKNRLIDDIACELAAHGCLHLVGVHH